MTSISSLVIRTKASAPNTGFLESSIAGGSSNLRRVAQRVEGVKKDEENGHAYGQVPELPRAREVSLG